MEVITKVNYLIEKVQSSEQDNWEEDAEQLQEALDILESITP